MFNNRNIKPIKTLESCFRSFSLTRMLTRETVFRQSSPVKYLCTSREYRMKCGLKTQEIFHTINCHDTDYEQVHAREMELIGSEDRKRTKTERDRHLSTQTALP
jgi:hypothetical protein